MGNACMCACKEVKCYVYMGVSENSGTPKSSILIGFSIINHPFWGTPIFGNTHILWFIHMYIYYIYMYYCTVSSVNTSNSSSKLCFVTWHSKARENGKTAVPFKGYPWLFFPPVLEPFKRGHTVDIPIKYPLYNEVYQWGWLLRGPHPKGFPTFLSLK